MAHQRYFKIILLYSIVCISQMANSTECLPKQMNVTPSSFEKLSRDNCLITRNSKICKDVYSEIKNKTQKDPSSRALRCDDAQPGPWMTSARFIAGCLLGGWNFTKNILLSPFEIIGLAGSSIGEFAWSLEEDNLWDKNCSQDEFQRKAIYDDYNSSVPKLMQVESPDWSDPKLSLMSCKSIRYKLWEQQMARAKSLEQIRLWSMNPNTLLNAEEQEYINYIKRGNISIETQSHVTKEALNYLKKQGVELQCYNSLTQAAMICEAALEVATLPVVAGATFKAHRLANILKYAGKVNAATQPVSILWYPNAKFLIFSHVELKVGTRVYNNTAGTIPQLHRAAEIEQRAMTNGKAYYEFSLKLSESEMANLRNYITSVEGQRSFQSCVSGTCKVLRNATPINIPPPFRYVPTLTALYLTAAKKLGYSKILNIRYVGKNELKTMFSPMPPAELALTAGAGALIMVGLDALGKKITHVIPIETPSKNPPP